MEGQQADLLENLFTSSQEQLLDEKLNSFLKDFDRFTDNEQFTRIIQKEPAISISDDSIGENLNIHCEKIDFGLAEDGQIISSGFKAGESSVIPNDEPLVSWDWSQFTPETTTVAAEDLEVDAVPFHSDWPGTNNFNVTFDLSQEKKTKSASWTFSQPLNKLFANINSPCPIRFHASNAASGDFNVRVVAAFSNFEDASKPVHRCPVHIQQSDPSNFNFPFRDHFMRIDNSLALYEYEPNMEIRSVIVPMKPLAGSDFVPYIIKFMCLSTCVGAIDRKPLQLIFTLEKNRKVVGRRTIQLKICRCPGRDKASDEQNQKTVQKVENKVPEKQTEKKSVQKSKKTKMTKTMSQEIICLQPSAKYPRLAKNVDGSKKFIIEVEKREHYEILAKLKQSLELADRVSPEVMAEYQAKERTRSSALSINSNTDQAKEVEAPLTRVVSIPVDTTDVKQEAGSEILKWLQGIEMQAYYDIFVQHGITEMHQILSMSRESLKTLGIGEGHQDAMWSSITKLLSPLSNKTVSLSQESRSSNISLSQGSGSFISKRFTLSRYKIIHKSSIAKDHDYLK